MSLEIITGKTGEPHIDSEDIGAYNAYTIGKDSYLLNGLDMSITNVNTLHVGTGEVLFQGRHVRIKGNGEDVAIANGTTGYKRNDILCLKYQKFPQNSDIESISLELIKGTPTTGTPADPAITTGSILNGDTVVYLKLARIVVNGLTPAAPVKLLGTVKTLADTAQTVAQVGASVDSSKASLFLTASTSYTDLNGESVPPGGTYTVPATGYYVLGSSGVGGANAWWAINGHVICGGNTGNVYSLVPLAKGTVLSTRNFSGANYEVAGYFTI